MKTFGWIQSTAQDNITAEKKDNISFSNLIFKYTWEQQVVLQYGFFLHIQIYRPTVQLTLCKYKALILALTEFDNWELLFRVFLWRHLICISKTLNDDP